MTFPWESAEAWQAQIVPMMKNPPDYEQVWSDWLRTCTGGTALL